MKRRGVLFAALLTGLVVRIAALPLPGTEDVGTWKIWAFGASRNVTEVYGVGGDPPVRGVVKWQALETTVANAADNGVVVKVAAPESLPPGIFDLVLANILAGPLVALEPQLAARTRRSGRIALSGILESQAAEVAQAYARDFDIDANVIEEGWALVSGVRR